MKLIVLFIIACTLLQSECYPQQNNSPNVQLIQAQLQQLLDQEAKLQALRQMLLAQLNPQKEEQNPIEAPAPNSHPSSTPVIGNVVFGSAEFEAKQKEEKSSVALNFPFTEVQLESGGIRILGNKEPNRRVVTS